METGAPVMGNKRHRIVATRRTTETASSLDLPRHISTLPKAVVGRALLPCAASRAVITVARDSVESRATAEPVWPEVSRECLAQELQYARPRLGIRMCISSRRAATDLTPYSSNCLARHAAALTTLHSRGSPLAQRYARCETIRAAGRGSTN